MFLRKADKVESVAELKDRIRGSQITVLSKYQGINVEQATELRRRLRAQAVHFKVFKNTLARRALDELGLSRAAALMEGPTAWAFCDDPVAPAKILKEFAKEVKVVEIPTSSGHFKSRASMSACVGLRTFNSTSKSRPEDCLI